MKKHILLPLVLSLSAALWMGEDRACAQDRLAENTNGSVIYTLPRTSIRLTVEAVRESYYAGPYARFASKYLGIEVPESNSVNYRLQSIKLIPTVEADPQLRMVADLSSLKKPKAVTDFFQLSSQGLVILSDDTQTGEEVWRFPAPVDLADRQTKGMTSNLIETETTMYRSVRSGNGFERVPVTQSQVVSKSLETKAEEAAQLIFDLRRKRIQIITGDTDATFSGSALDAAIAEINRLEEEYLSLFLGEHTEAVETLSFDVVPETTEERQLQIAFRISEEEGILPADNVAGRPVALELIPEATEAETTQYLGDGIPPKKPTEEITYRIPSICTARLSDGRQVLLQTRIPVYQMGKTLSFPIGAIIK